ncbi:hypothetical protein EI427_18490 [Flammeovirga pectinis]|uniref:Uncharacterized protein n=1 Tax=Flammeovirga pectinis TaxID=2494373 RepID=A0A3Q9FR61_9BACT|nr:hypothetical protein [Flammeovirga pectinis]AZQ64140.1 hypothetical protein EI427_18490 [Flammeovirga pectinis]
MKKIFFVLSLLIGMSIVSNAQSIDAETIKTVIKTEKRIFFTENMQLTLEEAPIFWELYDKFELDNSELSREKTKLFETLIGGTDGFSDEEASTMVSGLVALQAKDVKLKKKHLKMMSKELAPKTVARFFQLNELINSFLKTQILSEMPIVQK